MPVMLKAHYIAYLFCSGSIVINIFYQIENLLESLISIG